jgi:membrane protein DedA with SNARE-associated domain
MVELASNKYGNYLIFFARFIPGARTAVYFSLGTFKKPFYLFLLIDGTAALISVPLWIYVGNLFGQNIPALEHYIKHMRVSIYIFVAAVILLIVLFHVLNKRILALFFKKVF